MVKIFKVVKIISMKFIVSSKAMWILMENIKGTIDADDDYYTMKVQDKKLHFEGIMELDIEVKSEGEIDLTRKQFKRLRKVLRAIEEQPIVISNDGRSLQIHGICF